MTKGMFNGALAKRAANLLAKISGHVRLVPRKTRPYAEIDDKVKDLVAAMNATGQIRTIASCHGHGGYLNSPYVYFKSTDSTAAAIHRALHEAGAVLNASWIVVGTFDRDYELTFRLYAPEYDKSAEYLLEATWYFVLHRTELDSDLAKLVEIVRSAVIAQLGQSDVPKGQHC